MFLDFLGRAKASAGELRAQSYVAMDVDYLNADQFKQIFSLAETCSRQISKFMTYLQSRN
jgi:four helix bundle protein